MTVDNFGRMLKTTQTLKNLGFLEDSMNKKFDLRRIILEFVNDLRKEHLGALLTAEFHEHRDIIIDILFTAEINHMDVFLSVLAPNINSAKVARLTIDLLNNMVTSDKSEILCLFWREVQEVIDKIHDTEKTNAETFNKIYAFQKSLNSIRDKVAPERISLDLLRRTRSWRGYSVEQLSLLRQNPKVECWHFAEILLDWLQCDRCHSCILKMNIDTMEACIKLRKMCIKDLEEMDHKRVGSSYYASFLCNELRNLDRPLTQTMDVVEIYLYPLGVVICKWIEWFFVVSIMSLFIIVSFSLAMTSPQPSDILSYIRSMALILSSLKRFEMPSQLAFISNLEAWRILMYGMFLYTFFNTIVKRDPLFSLALNFLRQLFNPSVCVAFRERESFLLIDSATVKVTPYFDSTLYRFDWSYQANVRLLKVNGMMEVEIKNAFTDEDYGICHTYMIYGNPLHSKITFVSIFTNNYKEIIEGLKQGYVRCSECSKNSNFISLVRDIFYLFGERQFRIYTISS